MNNSRYIALAFLLLSSVVAVSIRGLGAPLLASFEVADPLVLGSLSASTLVAAAIGVGLFFFLLRHRPSYTFTDEAVGELRKTTWPGREETIRSTTIVIGTTAFLATMMATYDLVWAKVTSTFLFTAG